MTTTTARPLRVLPGPRTSPAGVPLPTHGDLGRPDRPPAPYVQDALAVDLDRLAEPPVEDEWPVRDPALPDPQEWGAHVGQALVEVMHGARPPAQLMRWTTPEVYAVLARRGALAARRAARPGAPAAGRRTRVVRVRSCEPADDVAEVSVVLADGGRVRALALRLVGRHGRWLVEDFRVG